MYHFSESFDLKRENKFQCTKNWDAEIWTYMQLVFYMLCLSTHGICCYNQRFPLYFTENIKPNSSWMCIHMSVNKAIIYSGNGLSYVWCHSTTWTKVDLLSIWTPVKRLKSNLNQNTKPFNNLNVIANVVSKEITALCRSYLAPVAAWYHTRCDITGCIMLIYEENIFYVSLIFYIDRINFC